jgi:hypothetical protein
VFFVWDITVPAGTAEASPKTQALKLTAGVVTRVDLKYPAGCKGMVKVRILHAEFQLVPLSRGEWVTGDNETVPTETFFTLPADLNSLKFAGCSPGTSYPHTVTVRVNVEPEEVASYWPLTRLFKLFLERIGAI